ncbi:MAG: hypothetical protein ACQESR_24825 [Planctomycetota bacterium]
MDEHVQKNCQDAAMPLPSPEPRALKVRLACGLVSWISTIYRAARRGRNADRGEQLVGL